METRVYTGSSVDEVLDDVARLRIAVFRDWPYLYDGDLAYEREYLTAYRSPGAIVVVAFDEGRVVGASTGAAMEDHAEDFAEVFATREERLDEIFYCAESVLLDAYRGRGLGHAFFDAREAHARAMGRTYSAFASVVRPPVHPLRPVGYRPLDAFWRGRGYSPVEGAVATFTWKDIDEASASPKSLQFWMRKL